MKKPPIVILEEHADYFPFEFLIKNAEFFRRLGYDTMLLEHSEPTFAEWFTNASRNPRNKIFGKPWYVPTLQKIFQGEMPFKYLTIDTERPVGDHEVVGFSDMPDPAARQRYIAGKLPRERAISENFNRAFAENQGCLTLFGAAHVNTFYDGFVREYPEHARNIFFVYIDKSSLLNDPTATLNPPNLKPRLIWQKNFIRSLLRQSSIPLEQIIIINLPRAFAGMERALTLVATPLFKMINKDIDLASNKNIMPLPEKVNICACCSQQATIRCNNCDESYCSEGCKLADWQLCHSNICADLVRRRLLRRNVQAQAMELEFLRSFPVIQED